jgi:hypothetical protein
MVFVFDGEYGKVNHRTFAKIVTKLIRAFVVRKGEEKTIMKDGAE